MDRESNRRIGGGPYASHHADDARQDDEVPLDDRYTGVERRDDWSSQMPWYVRAIAVIGIPGVLVIYLVWMGAQELPRISRQTDQQLAATMRNREILQEHSTQTAAILRMLQRICANGARNDEDRARCFD